MGNPSGEAGSLPAEIEQRIKALSRQNGAYTLCTVGAVLNVAYQEEKFREIARAAYTAGRNPSSAPSGPRPNSPRLKGRS